VDEGAAACRKLIARPVDVTGADSMLDRVGGEAMLRVPVGRPEVKRGGPRRVRDRQSRAEQLREQVVIAIPAPLVVERDQEDVGLFEPFERGWRRFGRSACRIAGH
jgi:hypothetical protein